jgi:hypothetical protein
MARPGQAGLGWAGQGREFLMYVTYRFSLPEDSVNFETFRRAPDMAGAISDFAEFLRHETKYPAEATLNATLEERNRLSGEWWRILGEYGLDPYDL